MSHSVGISARNIRQEGISDSYRAGLLQAYGTNSLTDSLPLPIFLTLHHYHHYTPPPPPNLLFLNSPPDLDPFDIFLRYWPVREVFDIIVSDLSSSSTTFFSTILLLRGSSEIEDCSRKEGEEEKIRSNGPYDKEQTRLRPTRQ